MDLSNLEGIVFTQLKTRVTRAIGTSYPNMSFTTELSEDTPSFPNVYLHEISTPEVGNTLENNQIHAYDITFQIEVTSNVSKSETKTVFNACIRAFKDMCFTINIAPYQKINNIHRYIFRARRVIAQADKF